VFLASVRAIGECVEIRLAFGQERESLEMANGSAATRATPLPLVSAPLRIPPAPLSDLRRDYPADTLSCAIAVGSPRRAIAVATAADHYRRSGSIRTTNPKYSGRADAAEAIRPKNCHQ
jgi:hypothetical protein